MEDKTEQGRREIDIPSVFESSNYRGLEYLQTPDQSLYMIICGIEQCLPGWHYDGPARPGYHLHVVLSGKGKILVRGCEFEVHAGQMFVVKEQERMVYTADKDDPWYYTWVTYGGSSAGEYLEYAGFTEGVYVRDCHMETNEFLNVVMEILKRPHLNRSSEVYRMSLAMRFLSLAIESFEQTSKEAGEQDDISTDDYVNYAVEYINHNYANIRISDVAGYIGVNRTYFSGIFKKKMLLSPQDYLMQVRMNKSRDMLMSLDVPVYVIAQKVGYDDQLAFSRMFKKKFGLSPENYRKKYRT